MESIYSFNMAIAVEILQRAGTFVKCPEFDSTPSGMFPEEIYSRICNILNFFYH
jgi:hypothetical protein